MTTPIVDFVRRYAQSGTARLHMPGHKGQSLLGCEPWDITEIRGADELYEAEGIIAQSEANATRLFGTAHTYYSTEGSSQCIRAMLCLAMQGAPRTGKRPVLLAARNAHKALLYAAALLDFDIRWLWPAPEDTGALCSCPVTVQALSAALEELAGQGRTPFGVYLTSPDYLGGMQDIAALSAVCDAHGVPLLVDNAHGAYLRFLPGGSRHPIDLGAAACCDSGHKTLPVLTGGAYLHLGPKAPVQEESTVRNALALFGSTSPSYLILQSLDACNRLLSTDYPARLQECCDRLAALRARLNALAAAQGTALPLALDGPAREPMKLTLDAAALGLTGQALADHLRQDGMECEYADPRYLGKPGGGLCPAGSGSGRTLCVGHPPGRIPCRAPGGVLCAGPAGGAPPDCAAGRVCPAGDHPGRVCAGQGLRSAHCVLPARHSHRGQRRGDRPGGAGAFRSLRRGDGLGGETGKILKNQGGSARFCGSETY